MYPVSNTFKDYIKQNTVTFSWHGVIVDSNNNFYTLTPENIVQSTGKITKRISQDQLSIGTTCASELQINLYLDVDRYLLFGGTITLYFTLYMGNDTEDVPMGTYTIAECNQSSGQISIVAYDNMTKFDDVKVSVSDFTESQSPYGWLTQACYECGVVLGSTSSDISSLPNGNRITGFADVVSGISSWRDVLHYLSMYLGAFTYIGRDGKLYLNRYTSNSIDTISSSFRYSSNLSDYRTTYDGIYGIYKAEGVQEYVENQNHDGLVLDLGTNPFMQFTEEESRLDALQEIIDSWNNVYYVPFDVTMPIVPYYDPGDVVSFTDNQAGEYDTGAITEIVYAIGGNMSIECAGDNPRLASAQDRFTKTIAGLASEYNTGAESGGKNFWLLHTDNIATAIIGSTKSEVAEIEWDQSVDVQRMGFMFTCDGVLSRTGVVKILITVDDDEDYEFEVTESKSMNGKRTYNSTCGFRVTGKGTHEAKVYMTVTDSPLLWSELG